MTFLGAIVRKLGNWMPISGTIELTGQLGLDDASVRTAVSRLKKRGWLDTRTHDGLRGYQLTPHARAELAAGDEIIWHARKPADLADGWCVVTFSVPESARARRHQLRSHLAALGFGNASGATWIAPARMLDSARKAIAELGLTGYCSIFVGDYAGGKDLPVLLNEAWDLTRVDADYRSFLERHASEAETLRGVRGEEAFVRYLMIVDEWRKLPYRDPGLPPEILPGDWSGPAATALFEDLVAGLEGHALAHAARYWSAGAGAAVSSRTRAR